MGLALYHPERGSYLSPERRPGRGGRLAIRVAPAALAMVLAFSREP